MNKNTIEYTEAEFHAQIQAKAFIAKQRAEDSVFRAEVARQNAVLAIEVLQELVQQSRELGIGTSA